MLSPKHYRLKDLGTVVLKGGTLPKSINFPDAIDGITILNIDKDSDLYSLETISFPKGCKSLADNLFSTCTELKSAKLPPFLKSIGNSCFANTKVESFKIPDSCKKIGHSAFANNEYLKDITLPKDITTIETKTFYNCKKLSAITLPENIKKIERDAFANCMSLKNIIFPSSVTFLGINAFCGCSELKKVVLPENLTELEDGIFEGGVFENCTSLQSVKISSKISIIPNYTFNGCTSLRKIVLPANIKIVGTNSFASCTSLKEIRISTPVAFDKNSFINSKNVSIIIDTKLSEDTEYIENLKKVFPSIPVISISETKKILRNIISLQNADENDINKVLKAYDYATTKYIEEKIKDKTYSCPDLNEKLKLLNILQVLSQYNADKKIDIKMFENER